MQNSMRMFPFFVLDQKYPFGQICSLKSKLLVSAEIWYLDQFKYAEFNYAAHFFHFRHEILFFGKFSPKNLNYQFLLKFGS